MALQTSLHAGAGTATEILTTTDGDTAIAIVISTAIDVGAAADEVLSGFLCGP
jgi:hypothetical protein